MTLEFLQTYWWIIISILGAALVFMLFVQGGQSMLYCKVTPADRQLMVNALGRKWELTFTTLVVFGGAFFASFPLYYSTSFGGAYWLWLTILISFVLQAVSYEFRRKKGNLYGTRTYDTFLMLNGLVGSVMLGVAVGMMFFGADFTIAKGNILDGTAPVISQWGEGHGLREMCDINSLILGFAVFFLGRTQAALYFINAIKAEAAFDKKMRRQALINGLIFAVLFVTFLVKLMLVNTYRCFPDGRMAFEENIYLSNLLGQPWMLAVLLIGVVLVLYGIFSTALRQSTRYGIWYTGIGTAMVVVILFFMAGFNNTPYLWSVSDIHSSLTIANSSASYITLQVMSIVSLLVPFVLLYIIYVWRKMNSTPLTTKELNAEHHSY